MIISPTELVAQLRGAGSRRAYLVNLDGRLRPSHAFLQPLAERIVADRENYRGHLAIFFEIGKASEHLLCAFIDRTRRGQAAGGVRYWSYETTEQLVHDGLRLATGMGHKCALAGLWWGGGKGVIARRSDLAQTPALRQAIYQDYGRFISGLRGCYVTAEDVGTRPADMAAIFQTTRHTTCIPPQVGGSGNPSVLTARGVVVAMEAALEARGLGSLAGKRIAMQGLGQVSLYMIGELLERGVERIIGHDIDPQAIAAVRERYADSRLEVRCVDRNDTTLFSERCDVLAPNAVGAVLNPQTIPQLRAKIICGGANNQLAEMVRDGRALAERGIVYVPDFVANRMGIVNCANEQYGCLSSDPAIERHLDRQWEEGIFQRVQQILTRTETSQRSTAEEAVQLADELAEHPHPIWGDRARMIVADLVDNGWAASGES